MVGALIINKPVGLTSRDVINKLNRLLETKEIGHIGTLDPMATGVLVCLIGRAVKLSNILINHDKEYIASFKLGILTDTLDTEGKVLKEESVELDETKIEEAINSFKGTYLQEVPIYSAVKVNGKKLYEYARNNEEVTLPKKMVTIHDISLKSIKEGIITIKVRVSKGTYIRSLIRDIGERLGTCATMTDLVRSKLGDYYIEDAIELEEVINNIDKIVSVNELLKEYPHEEIDAQMLYRVGHGQILDRQIEDYILFTSKNEPIALYQKYHEDETKIKPAVMFYINNKEV